MPSIRSQSAFGYAELICKTNYSFLRGASHPHELMLRAQEIGLSGLAITDLNGLYGMPKAYLAVKDQLTSTTQLIVGAEVIIRDHPSVVLIAQDRKAYGLLCRLITASHAGKQKGEAHLLWNELLFFLQKPEAHRLFCLPTHTLLLPKESAAEQIFSHQLNDNTTFEPRYAISESQTKTDLAILKDICGERIFLPLARNLDGHDKKRTSFAKKLIKEFGIQIVATNDVQLHVPGRKPLHDVLTSIRHSTTLEEAGFKLLSNGERHLKSPQEMHQLFQDLPEALQNTLLIKEQCVFSPSELRYRYPSEWIPQGETAHSFLTKLTMDGARERYKGLIPQDVQKQLEHELKLVRELHFEDYFLTIWDIVEFAKKRQILCQGRGSAANSAVCYCLGITAVDPVRMNLLFERFISAERGEPPDIDVDFEHERREEVIQYIYQKYGRDRAGMVAAVITYRTKSAVREVSKTFGKLWERKDWERESTDPKDLLIKSCIEEIKGFPRHLSIHSGGFTLSADPLIETVPIEPARMEDRTIVQWDKYDLDALGLLKIDVLALGMLSAIKKTLDQIGMKLHEIPPEDIPTYKMIQKAETVGTFQIESRAQMNMLGRLQPRTFYDLVIQVAIVRPGPIVGKMVHPYLKRRKGLEPIIYYHPKLKTILGRTLGVPLFQEQVMKMAIELASFTPGEADALRRAIGAWRSSGSIEKMGKKLMKGLLESGLPQDYVERIFLQIQGFAEYGFPESHAASFALIAYASCFLKCHFPAEFTCGLINSQPMGFYPNHTLIDEAKRQGVEVLPVDPNISQWHCTVTEKKLRLGFCVVRGMSKGEAEKIISEREQSRFLDFNDFLRRTKIRQNVLQRLALGDAFKIFGLHQRDALWHLLEFYASYLERSATQLTLFQNLDSEIQQQKQEADFFQKMSKGEEIGADYKSFGLSLRGHPMSILREQQSSLPKITVSEVKNKRHQDKVKIAGMALIRQRPPTANGTMFMTLEDETGFVDLVISPQVFEKCREDILDHSIFVADGTIHRDHYALSIQVKNLKPLEFVTETKSRDGHGYSMYRSPILII